MADDQFARGRHGFGRNFRDGLSLALEGGFVFGNSLYFVGASECAKIRHPRFSSKPFGNFRSSWRFSLSSSPTIRPPGLVSSVKIGRLYCAAIPARPGLSHGDSVSFLSRPIFVGTRTISLWANMVALRRGSPNHAAAGDERVCRAANYRVSFGHMGCAMDGWLDGAMLQRGALCDARLWILAPIRSSCWWRM